MTLPPTGRADNAAGQFRSGQPRNESVVPGNGVGRLQINPSTAPDEALERRKAALRARIAELERENEEHKDSWNPYHMARNSIRRESIDNARSMLADLEAGRSRGFFTQLNDGVVALGDSAVEGVEGVGSLTVHVVGGGASVAGDVVTGNFSGAGRTLSSGASAAGDAIGGMYDDVVHKPWFQGTRDAWNTGQIGAATGGVALDAAGVAGAAKSVGRRLATRLGEGLSAEEAAAARRLAEEEEARRLADAKASGNNAVEREGRPGDRPADTQEPTVRSEPVEVASGAFVERWEDVRLDGTIPFTLDRYYGALLDLDGPFGRNRTSFLDASFTVTADNKLLYRDEQGRRIVFDRPFNLGASFNNRRRHLTLRAPWLKELELEDRGLTRYFKQGKSGLYNLVRVEDRNGNTLLVTRDEQGFITRAVHSDGYQLTFTNDPGGLRQSITRTSPTAPDLLLASYGYDRAGNLLRADCATAFSISYEYDPQSRLIAWKDNTRRTQSVLEYDGENRVVHVRTTGPFNDDTFEYDRANRTTTYRHGGGAAFERFVHDGEESVVEETNALGETRRYAYEDGYRISETDGEGNTTAFSYDHHGNVMSQRDPAGRVTLCRWGTRGELDLVIGHEGHTSRYEHDDRGNPVALKDASGAVTRYAWTSSGKLASVTHPDGAQEHFDYDASHQLVAHRAADGGVTRYGRDFIGRVTSMTDAAGASTQFTYGASGTSAFWEPTGIERADGGVLRRGYDGEGQLASVTDGEGRTTTYHYGPFDRLLAIQDPKGGVLRLEYDVAGQVSGVVNANGRRYTYERDLAGRVVAETDFDGRVLRYERDKAGRVSARLAPDGSRLNYAYDPSGLLTLVEAYEPDEAGRLRAVPSATESFTYDGRGMLSGACNGAAQVLFERDALGRVVAESQNHRRVASTYDARGRRTERAIGFAAGWGAGGQAARRFQGLRPEDIAAGRLLAPPAAGPPAMPAPEGATRYAYDPLGLLSELSLAVDPAGVPGEVVRFRRDSLGREVERSNGSGFVLEQGHDALGRLAQQRVAGPVALLSRAASGTAPSAPGRDGYTRTYAYDRTSAPVVVSDDLWGATRYGYDERGQVTEARHGEAAAGGGVARAQLSTSVPGGSLGLGEDAVEVERFVYDAAWDVAASDTALPGEPLGRAVTPWLVSVGGRVQAARGPAGERVVLTHDACGRVVERRVERSGFRPRVWRYQWDAFDRLVACVTSEGESWRYGYDPFGRRVEKRRVDTGGGSGGACFTWDGDVVAEAVPVAPDGTLAVARRVTWHFAPGGSAPLAREAGDGEVHHVVTDQLGTPRELVSPRGELVWAAAWRLWGGLRARWRRPDQPVRVAANGPALLGLDKQDDGDDSAEEDLCPFRFQGQWEDTETGLRYNRHRYYDPQAAQFLSPDPIALLGSARPQAYVDCPTTWVDPFGLEPRLWDPTGRPPTVYQGPFGRLYEDQSVPGQFWSRDITGHGGSAWKVYDRNSAGDFTWTHDADQYGNFLDGVKHKGETGRFISRRNVRRSCQ